jgi:hypothetical protein
MAFSIAVEMLNIRLRRKVAAPIILHRVRKGEVK